MDRSTEASMLIDSLELFFTQPENNENGADSIKEEVLPPKWQNPTVDGRARPIFDNFELQLGDSRDELRRRSRLPLRLQFYS
ncbi:hypothetical protein M9H77_18710 [Catharanthus roseus]|uniref:Uncharacterized protein n=1 Tax=Catharanthus roseus TaxID=4058 RepID=A0ACC0B8C7_CATRO|nr:hypothetical protein M9H77_18710 [Catharanthus roseus]